MNLLLDTHLLLWSAFAAERIAPATAKRLLDPANVLWFHASLPERLPVFTFAALTVVVVAFGACVAWIGRTDID